MSRHPKYKTEMCRTFHSTGLCPYGPRCHFIHDPNKVGRMSTIWLPLVWRRLDPMVTMLSVLDFCSNTPALHRRSHARSFFLKAPL